MRRRQTDGQLKGPNLSDFCRRTARPKDWFDRAATLREASALSSRQRQSLSAARQQTIWCPDRTSPCEPTTRIRWRRPPAFRPRAGRVAWPAAASTTNTAYSAIAAARIASKVRHISVAIRSSKNRAAAMMIASHDARNCCGPMAYTAAISTTPPTQTRAMILRSTAPQNRSTQGRSSISQVQALRGCCTTCQ